MSDVDRFMTHVSPEPNTGCWLWTLPPRNRAGYGGFRLNGKVEGAHRAAWMLFRGPIPLGEGFHGTCLCHKCDTPACVNPEHLFLGSHTENVRDAIAKGRRSAGPPARRGSDTPNSKLTEAKVVSIREHLKTKTPQQDIAALYGVSPATVTFIKQRKVWAHVA